MGGGKGPCTCTAEHIYDVYDVTSIAVAAVAAQLPLVLAVQAYNIGTGPQPLDSKVQISLLVTYAHGAGEIVVATGAASPLWRTYNGDAWMNTSCCTASQWYTAPRENWVAALEPVGWRSSLFNDSTWEVAATKTHFAYPLVARPARHLALAVGIHPTLIETIAPGHTFIDLGREVQGGVIVTFENATAGTLVYARFGETLISGTPGSPPAVRYMMSTGNQYWMGWTLRGGSQQIEIHEVSGVVIAVTTNTHDH